ncbi:MAG: DUF262 domain-containing protein [Candidatus Eisenbacteria sp.]|nr:DUF262 domain-containing protein [Candidatus Eisenbacteria bacterium]
MHAEDRTLGVVFETTVRFLVPLFQRPYVWKQNDNWEPLWESIRTAADRRLTGSTVRPHFLGAIVLEQLKTETGEVDARQVIDGQQRLTTLQLMIAAIRDICAVKGSADYQEAFKRLSENYVPSKKNLESTFKVWPTNVDREHFGQAMTARSLDALAGQYGVKANARDYGHLIPNCYKYFHDQVLEWLDGVEGDALNDRLDLLFNAIRQDLVLVVVDLGSDDDPQLIFETLNALGTPLQPADLVKNFLFHWAQRQGADTPVLYEQMWRPFDDNVSYWREEIRQGRLKWHRIDLFLAHYLTLLRKDVVSMTHLFGEFREYFTDGNETAAEEHIRQLRSYADVYHGFDQYPEGSREALFFQRLEALDTNMAIPVLLEVLRKPDSEEDKNLFLDYLESYLVRRAVCCLTYKNYNRIFVDMIKHLASTRLSSSELLTFLLARKGDSAEWPTDDQFRKAFCEYEIYKWMKQARTRMVLEAIERAMRDGKSEKIAIREKLTIEHIMPQEWRLNWPMPDDATPEDEAKRNETLHRFGNLTLVTGKLNPSLSNAAWAEKKAAIMEHSALAMNRKFQDATRWNETTIADRGEKMFDLALKIWPRPSIENVANAQGETPTTEVST